jgi:MFS family permease
MARIMITWGIISACTALVQGPLSFYAVRFLLGVAEAGFFPGMILYLSYWFPARERAKAVGFFMSAIAISYAIGAPLSGAIMSVFDGVAGLRDWQWLFVIEAAPAVLAGLFVLTYLDDSPKDATWLADDEKSWLARRLEGEERTRMRAERHSVGEALKDRRVLTFGLLYFCMVVNVYGLSFWVGEIVDNISGLSVVGKGFVTAIPYSCAIVGLVLISRRSDRTGDRKGHISVCLAVAAAAFIVSTVVSPVAAIAALAVGLFFLLGAHPVFWTMPAALLSGTAAAAGIALINSIGNLGGFVGPYLVGLVQDATGSTDGGLIALAAILLGGSVLATRVAHDPALERAPREEARFTREGAPAADDRVSPARRTASSSRSPS